MSELALIDEVLDRLTAPGQGVSDWQAWADDPLYFITTYCRIYDPELGDWAPFDLWPAQADVLRQLEDNQLLIALKARQLGMTWLMLAYALWQALFRPIATALLFSKRDDEAVYLLSDERLMGMYELLPDWIKAKAQLTNRSAHILRFSNGSTIRAFPTTSGDTYTATFALVDEADLVPDLDRMLRSVRPTIDAGGKLVLLSRADKSRPNSAFKKIYRAAKQRSNNFAAVFLPWFVHPKRDTAWYEAQCKDAQENTGALDYIHEQYPATDAEALAPATLDKRIPAVWLQACYTELPPLANLPPSAPTYDGLTYFKRPEPGRRYAIGADCAEGLRASDDSTSYVLTADTAEVVAELVGKLSPATHASQTLKLSQFYNDAPVLPENNNHGHAFILWFGENGHGGRIARGHDDKAGWTSSARGKMLMYDRVAEMVKDEACMIHDLETYNQLASIEKNTLRAPGGEFDDMADGFALACMATYEPEIEVWSF